MSRRLRVAALLGILAIADGCDSATRHDSSAPDSALLAQREARLEQKLAHPDSDVAAPLARWQLPESLQEISGLALTADGRLLTHGDSRGRVFQVDYRRGTVVKEFTLGNPVAHADFESITTVGDTVMLLASDGILYQFAEGGNGKSVEYTTQDTGLGDKCEFEGLAYDATLKALLLACKKVHDKALKDSLIVYRWPLAPAKDTGKAKSKKNDQKFSYLAVPLARIIGSNDWTELHPSDITIDPFNGNYVLIASREKALFEITPGGAVVFARPLPPGHEQAEGVAITRDSILIISDEAKGGPAVITLYRWSR
jgi:uncharacterized protein YjiK